MKINLDPVPDRSSAEIQRLVEREIERFREVGTAAEIRTFLIEPRIEMRTWEWQRPHRQYPVWVIAEGRKYDYNILFSDYGFGPAMPWGLGFISHSEFGADYCWYPNLEQTYKESRLPEELDEPRLDK